MSSEEILSTEEFITRLSVSLGKAEYLMNIISQKLEKNTEELTEQEKEFFIYERDNIRMNLDIADDYIHEAVSIMNELRKGLWHTETFKKGGTRYEQE